MSSVGPAGPCEWCGGPQRWTIIRGDMYVSCDGGCLPLDLEGLVPPSDSEELVRLEQTPKMEHPREEGVVPLEGGDTDERDSSECAVESEPPVGWLSSLWEGGAQDG